MIAIDEASAGDLPRPLSFSDIDSNLDEFTADFALS